MPHDFHMPAEYIARVVARQGRVHACEILSGPSTALVVVDMQKYFMVEPFAGACPVAREIVPNVNRLARSVRAAGGRVVWLQMAAPWQTETSWSALRGMYRDQAAAKRWGAMQPDAEGFELWPELEVTDEDERVVKERYSAFIPGSSRVEDVLGGIDTLIVAGVATNVCCESTARDAMMLNYRVVMVSDGCAAASDSEHAAALGNFYLFFGDVQTTEEVESRLGTSA